MVADALKSTSITNLDSTPAVPNTTGEGGPGYLRNVSDYVTPTTGGLASTSSKYKMLRVPSNAKLKSLELKADAALDSNGSPTLAVDVGVYYSDSTVDGTQPALQGTVISATALTSNAAFGSTTTKFDALVGFGAVKRNQPLWQALALASDPGGFFDVVLAVHVVAATAVSAAVSASLNFVD